VDLILDLVAVAAIVAGTVFSFAGVLGYVRLPDVYTRLHATAKVGLFGAVLVTAGAVIAGSAGLGRALVLIVMLLLSGPVIAHSLASAAYRSGMVPWLAVQDRPAGSTQNDEHGAPES